MSPVHDIRAERRSKRNARAWRFMPVTIRCRSCDESLSRVTVTDARLRGWRGPDGHMRVWSCPAHARRGKAS